MARGTQPLDWDSLNPALPERGRKCDLAGVGEGLLELCSRPLRSGPPGCQLCSCMTELL